MDKYDDIILSSSSIINHHVHYNLLLNLINFIHMKLMRSNLYFHFDFYNLVIEDLNSCLHFYGYMIFLTDFNEVVVEGKVSWFINCLMG